MNITTPPDGPAGMDHRTVAATAGPKGDENIGGGVPFRREIDDFVLQDRKKTAGFEFFPHFTESYR